MIVKKIGILLIYRMKLYRLIKLLTLPLILLAFMLPFTDWNFSQSKQKFDFQQPSLRTKLFDLNYEKEKINQPIEFELLSRGVKAVIFQGMLSNQCILLIFPSSFQQSLVVRILNGVLRNDDKLAKNIVLLSYESIEDLKNLFDSFHKGQIQLRFGTIRIALNIDHIVRKSKQKQTTSGLKVYYQIYGKGGLHADVDHYQSIKQLLQRVHVEWSPCEEIHKDGALKFIRKGIFVMAQYVGNSRQRIQLFVDHLLCQGHKLFTRHYNRGHEALMEYGFQSTSLTFLSNEPFYSNQNKPLSLESQKIAKLIYSFAKQYSMQQDHLHSSNTLFYPINNHFYMSLVGTIYSGVILLVVGAANVIGQLVENGENVKSVAELWNVVEVVGLWVEFKVTRDVSGMIGYLCVKLVWKHFLRPFFSIVRAKEPVQKNLQLISYQHLLLAATQTLLSFYLSIFNFPLFFLSGVLSCLMLIKYKRLIKVFLIICMIGAIGLFSDTIKTQFLLISSGKGDFVERARQLTGEIVRVFGSVSAQAKVVILPFLYSVSTFWL